MKIKGEKNLLLLALFVALVSCGGGGGGGGSYTPPPTTSTTPTTPTTPTAPTTPTTPTTPAWESKYDSNGNIKWNDKTRTYDKTNPNNQTVSSTINGAGVTVGVLDMGFGTTDPDLITEMNNRFGSSPTGRLERKTNFGVATPHENHGIVVAGVVGGNSIGIAKKVNIIGVDVSKLEDGKYHPDPSLASYEYLRNSGVKIYNQSFGTKKPLGRIEGEKFVPVNFREELRLSLQPPGTVWDEAKITEEVDKLIKFYKTAVDEGSLFIWAAGNKDENQATIVNPSVQAGLPYFIPSLYKGWIAVVGLDEQPDGSAKDFPEHLAWAGKASYWSISANGNCGLQVCYATGSSNAAPRVAAVAAKVKERFPWMTGHEIQQTILTTATQMDERISAKYGWGYLNEEKALKGPAEFNNVLIEGQRVLASGNDNLKGQFNANIPDGIVSIFENDISGNGGLAKKGKGTLILTGNNTYTHDTDITQGTLELYGNNASEIKIGLDGKVIAYPKAVIEKNVQNKGTFENRGSGAVINGNYIATAGSVTKAEIGSKLTVNGSVNLNGGNTTLQTLSNGRYITARPLSSTIIEAKNGINGNFNKVKTSELVNGSIEKTGNEINVKLSRKNVLEYAKEAGADEMQKNTAQNLETAFQGLDRNIENGTAGNTSGFERKAAELQGLDPSNRAAILDSLSGQIYASAQALTFQHSQAVNKDLSNRLVMLGTLDSVGDKFGLWFSGFGANGRLRQDGYGKGNTKLFGGQVGIDRQFGQSLILGAALSYSEADVKFDRYGGKSDADNFGVSLYGRLGNKNTPWYLQGRFGIGFVDSDVERDIILSSSDYARAKINHNDKVYSGYLETGYDIKNSSGDLVVTPFVGLSHDTVTRGSFSEEKSQFGLTADKKRYSQTSALAGLRVGKSVKWSGGSKTTFQGYVTHQRAFKDQDLSFEARYTGLPGSTFKVKGIGLSKNKTWVGAGALTEVNSKFGWYVNYDGSIDSGKGKKGSNNVFTTGLRFNF